MSRINKTATTTKTKSLSGEKTKVEPLIVNPLLEIGATILRSCPPQIMLITERITPRSPRVAMIGATPAIGPDEACLTSKRIKINSTRQCEHVWGDLDGDGDEECLKCGKIRDDDAEMVG